MTLQEGNKMNDDMTYDEAIAFAKAIDEDRKLIKAIRYRLKL